MASKRKFSEKMADFMIGRNGLDDFARAAIGFAIVAIVLQFVCSLFSSLLSSLFGWICLGLLFYSWFRVLSKNIVKRQEENRAWVKRWSRVSIPLKRRYSHFKEWKKYHKEYRFYTCKTCKQSLKVPKGKGRLKVTCPKCHTSFETKS